MNTQKAIELLVRSHGDLSRSGPKTSSVFARCIGVLSHRDLERLAKEVAGLVHKPALEAAAIIRLRNRGYVAHTQ